MSTELMLVKNKQLTKFFYIDQKKISIGYHSLFLRSQAGPKVDWYMNLLVLVLTAEINAVLKY